MHWAPLVPGSLPAAFLPHSCTTGYRELGQLQGKLLLCELILTDVQLKRKQVHRKLSELIYGSEGPFALLPFDYLPYKVLTDTGCPQWELALMRSFLCEHSSGLSLEMEGDSYLFIRLNSTAQWSG